MDERPKGALSVRQFVTSRTQELVALSSRAVAKAVGPNGTSSYIPFKHIPKNLRRRAVSHNVKRIPFRFRPPTRPGQGPDATTAKASGNASKGDPLSFISSKKKTKSSRKHRRRKSNLLLEFNRRQRVNKWMETHIWHAKRFHIEAKWNYKIPIRPCDKGQRALYRSTKNYATMQDISFVTPLQLSGQFDELVSGFQTIAPKEANTLSIAAVMYTDGCREGRLHIYKRNSYPHGYIGSVNFMWLKNQPHSSGSSSLWLWIHPAIKVEIIDLLCEVFELCQELKSKSPLDSYNNPSPGISETDKMSIDEIKLLPKNLSNKMQWSNSSKTITMVDLEGELNRFRFSGPLIMSVLKEVLQPSQPEILNSEAKDKSLWFDNFNFQLLSQGSDTLSAQQILWGVLETIEDIPSHTIMPLVVRDPRVFLPKSRTKILLNGNSSDDSDDEIPMELDDKSKDTDVKVDEAVSASLETRDLLNEFIKRVSIPLEDPSVRSRLIKEKMTDHEFCDRRAGLLIPGSEIDLGREENQIPVTLVHRPASANSKGFNDGGFDLIVPAGWAMPFWIAFAYRATRIAGLRDSTCVAFSTGNLHSSAFSSPDSSSGTSDFTLAEQSNRENYFKFSPAKRPNLIKLNCASPFTPPWKNLLQFWNLKLQALLSNNSATSLDLDIAQEMPVPFVLRDKQLLSYLSQNVKSKYWLKLIQNLENMEKISQCLIGVRLDIIGGGRVTENSVICLPTLADVEIFKTRSQSGSLTAPPIHEEPPQDDELFHQKRKELKDKHEKMMSFLRRKRKHCRKTKRNLPFSTEFQPNSEECNEFKVKIDGLLKHHDSTLLSSVYNEQMKKLWLLPQNEESINDCLHRQSRIPMGFTLHGDDDYSRGHCSALGFISASALLQFAKNAQENKSSGKNLGSFVLVRNWTSSLVYRCAKLQILLT